MKEFTVFQLDFEERKHPVPPIERGERVRVTSPDEEDVEFSDMEGEITHITIHPDGWLFYVLLDGEQRTHPFLEREIQKVR